MQAAGTRMRVPRQGTEKGTLPGGSQDDTPGQRRAWEMTSSGERTRLRIAAIMVGAMAVM